MRIGWVYAFEDAAQCCIKIGRTREHPMHRMATIEAEFGTVLEAIFICYCNRYDDVEKQAHRALKTQPAAVGRGTEWFAVQPMQAINAIVTAVVELDACVPVPWPAGVLKQQVNIPLTPDQAKVMDALRGRERIVPTRNAYARWLLAEALVAQADKLTAKPKAKRNAA